MIELGTRNQAGVLHVWRLRLDGMWVLVKRNGIAAPHRVAFSDQFDPEATDLITWEKP